MEENRDSWLKIAWRLFYPLLLYMGIQMVAAMIGSIILTIVVLMDGSLLEADSMAEQILYIESLVAGPVGYYITLATNAITTPFAWLFYRSDKKKREGHRTGDRV